MTDTGRVQTRSAVVCKTFKFSAAHHMPDYKGLCRNVHGHTFTVEVYATGSIPTVSDPSRNIEAGMVIDFSLIAEAFDIEVDNCLDHTDLNETLPDDYMPPTTENIAAFILDTMHYHIPEVFKVRVYEGPNQFAEVDLYA